MRDCKVAAQLSTAQAASRVSSLPSPVPPWLQARHCAENRSDGRWCEHNPLEIWDSVCLCVEGALAAAHAAVGMVRVAALGITNQRETTLAWDRGTGRPLHNAIVWHDSRTAAICRSVTSDLSAVCAHTANP